MCRSFKQGKESLGKLVLLLLLYKALNRYNTDVCGVPAKNALEIRLFIATFLIDSECVRRLLVQSHLTGLECKAKY